MNFTSLEWEILEHRLEVPDCIAEVLEDSGVANYALIEDRAMQLQTEGRKILNMDDPLDREIIEECCYGSTYFNGIKDAVAIGELTRGQMLARFKAAKAIEEKTGWKVTR